MSDPKEITDEALTAYLDGQASDAERAEVEAALASSAEVEARLKALDVPLSALREGMDQVLGQAPAMPALPAVEPRSGRSRQWGAVAAALVIGLVMGGMLVRPAEPDWVDIVANYQSLYVTETLATPPIPEAERAEVVARLSGALGVDLAPLVGLEEIAFRRAQMLGLDGEPLVQMAYLAGDIPVAICVTPISGGDSAIETGARFGMEAASWRAGGFGYLVIGGDDSSLIRSVAESVRAAI